VVASQPFLAAASGDRRVEALSAGADEGKPQEAASRDARGPLGQALLVRLGANVAVYVLFSAAAAVTHASRFVRRVIRVCTPSRSGPVRLLLCGTFYNAGWFKSHILPLSLSRAVGRIQVVTEEPLGAVAKVTYVCPPKWLRRVTGRAAARLGCVLWTMLRDPPDILMGYHIMPNALICLLGAELFGRRSIYQMTGGPHQVIGGGWRSENVLLQRLGQPSRRREAFCFHVIRLYSDVIVRGRRAVEFAEGQIGVRRCFVVPGSVDCSTFSPVVGPKDYHLVTVGRLVECKQLHRLLTIVSLVKTRRRSLRVAVVGGGPLEATLRAEAASLGLGSNVDFLGQRNDVAAILRRGRAFVLTSRSEGLSIAMIEAMAAGLPPCVPDVGDLADLVREGRTGLFIDPQNPEAAAAKIEQLLDDPAGLDEMSSRARMAALEYVTPTSVAQRWDWILMGLGDQAAVPTGFDPDGIAQAAGREPVVVEGDEETS
jgi:glycosyltransferase involved in cell wall biosynthesis